VTGGNVIEQNAKNIIRLMVAKGLVAGDAVQNATIQANALQLGLDGEDLIAALIFAGERSWIENGPHGTAILTNDGFLARLCAFFAGAGQMAAQKIAA
jgi:hypothetical protein